MSGVPDFFDRNKILSGGDLSHYQVPHCIRVLFYFVWFVFIHHNFQFYFELCTYCNILDIYLSWNLNFVNYLLFYMKLLNYLFFIRPFEKRDVLCRGNVRPSVCPSVCPSVRPSVRVFRTFLQHALRYQFETWYIHSVGGTTCRVWVASQLGHFDLVYSQK